MKNLFSLSIFCVICVNGLRAEEVDLPFQNSDERFKREAESKISTTTVSSTVEGFVFKDDQGNVAARLNLTQGPFFLDLVKTTKDENGKVIYIKNDKKQVKSFGNSTLDQTKPTTSAVVSGAGGNDTTKIDITLAYEGMTKGDETFIVSSAVIKMSIELGGPTKIDFWNITSASITVNSTVNGTSTDLNINLTPSKFGYSPHRPDFACTTGYGICAPLGLSWSCDDQVMKPNSLETVGADQLAVFLHLPGMLLQPATGNSTNGFGFNWDCDPLIPLSLWVSILITLMLASILFWALYMLSALQTPNKFDDPKGPSIHVPQAE